MNLNIDDVLDQLKNVPPTDIDKKIAEERAVDNHGRDRITLDIIAWCLRILIIIVVVVVAFAILTLAWHTLAPDNLGWLDEGELQQIKDFMLSGALVSLAVGFMKRYI